jgi:hypothetical protein
MARKIGLLYAAGWIAQRAGLLPWDERRPRKVARYVYKQIMKNLPGADRTLENLIERLRTTRMGVSQRSASGFWIVRSFGSRHEQVLIAFVRAGSSRYATVIFDAY